MKQCGQAGEYGVAELSSELGTHRLQAIIMRTDLPKAATRFHEASSADNVIPRLSELYLACCVIDNAQSGRSCTADGPKPSSQVFTVMYAMVV